ncbi:MAG: PD40 domain-containing protein [Gemmatimonadaceae bacterium]|nr:PD40 domain-containing protein [Gemmatimonadaceae bacterium]
MLLHLPRPAASGALLAALALTPAAPAPGQAPAVIDVTVTEGTSMSVAASRDGRQLAIDLQGSIWVMPSSGGRAQRVTDEYNDARQPTWSPDGRVIAFQGYRDGGYDIWAVDADGTHLRQLTSGPFDDREPTWSADGRFVAFASDRGGSYDIWLLTVATGALRQVTRDPGEDYMPTFSPEADEIAFVSTRQGAPAVYAVQVSTGAERRLTTTSGRYDAPSWGPGGEIVVHNTAQGASRFEHNGKPITADENVFAFRAGWLSPGEIVYVADGHIRRRSIASGVSATIDFSATLQVRRAALTPRRRDTQSRVPRRALGVVAPVVSPDGRQVAFAALGNLYLMPVGGAPRKLTDDPWLDTEPAWSPDGRYLAWSSDRGRGTLLDLWVYDTQTGTSRQLTREGTSAMGAAWSPDGTRIAFLDVDGIWRRANVSVVDVATGTVTQIHPSLFGPGAPTWSPDGRRVLVAALVAYSTRFREGTNQLLSIPVDGGQPTVYTPVEHLSIDSRVGAGPAWSPDGRRVALIYEGVLAVVPVDASGRPVGPPRRLTNEIAHAPSWTGDSRSILYQSNERLRLLDVETGAVRDVPVALSYAPSIPTGQVLVHAGRLIDGRSDRVRTDVDVLIRGNRIERVVPHATHPAGVRVVDASGLTVMPGLIEYHTHLQKDLGEASYRAYLAFGVTTVRSPGSTPYEAVEDREAVDAGVRPGPRLFVTGYLMEWNRVYYKMAVAVSSHAHLDLELARAKVLEFDMLKSYVRMPDLQQKRIIEFAHRMGVPVSSHEVFPSTLSGIDATEHTTGTSRRGYSPKAATLQRSYADVAQLFAASGVPLTPTLALSGGGLRRLLERDTTLRHDSRFRLYPEWLQAQLAAGGAGGAPPGAVDANAGGRMVMGLMRAGTRIVAGTDTPNAATLHGELFTYVLAGMTPFEALKTATVNGAALLGLDAGTIEAGRLADLAIVNGNPLEDISATTRVRYTIANGRVFSVDDLVKP